MHGEEVIIPIIFFLSIVAIWGGILLTRHKERMTIIDKGLNPADLKALYERTGRTGNPMASLKWGIVLAFAGLAFLIGIWLREQYMANDGVVVGLVALFAGMGLVLFYFITSRKPQI